MAGQAEADRLADMLRAEFVGRQLAIACRIYLALAILARHRGDADGWFLATRQEVYELAMIEAQRQGGRQYFRRLRRAGVLTEAPAAERHLPNGYRLAFPGVTRSALYGRLSPDLEERRRR